MTCQVSSLFEIYSPPPPQAQKRQKSPGQEPCLGEIGLNLTSLIMTHRWSAVQKNITDFFKVLNVDRVTTAMSTECRRIECQPSVSRVSAECRQRINRLSLGVALRRLSPDRWVGRHSTDYCPLLVECRPCIGRHVDRLSTEWWPICQPSVDRVSITCWSRCRSLSSIDTRSQVSSSRCATHADCRLQTCRLHTRRLADLQTRRPADLQTRRLNILTFPNSFLN